MDLFLKKMNFQNGKNLRCFYMTNNIAHYREKKNDIYVYTDRYSLLQLHYLAQLKKKKKSSNQHFYMQMNKKHFCLF